MASWTLVIFEISDNCACGDFGCYGFIGRSSTYCTDGTCTARASRSEFPQGWQLRSRKGALTKRSRLRFLVLGAKGSHHCVGGNPISAGRTSSQQQEHFLEMEAEFGWRTGAYFRPKTFPRIVMKKGLPLYLSLAVQQAISESRTAAGVPKHASCPARLQIC
jgi:hypothetical protein